MWNGVNLFALCAVCQISLMHVHNGTDLIFRRIAKSMNSMMAFSDFSLLSFNIIVTWWRCNLTICDSQCWCIVRFSFRFVHSMAISSYHRYDVLAFFYTKNRMQKYATLPLAATPFELNRWLTTKRVCICILLRSPCKWFADIMSWNVNMWFLVLVFVWLYTLLKFMGFSSHVLTSSQKFKSCVEHTE